MVRTVYVPRFEVDPRASRPIGIAIALGAIGLFLWAAAAEAIGWGNGHGIPVASIMLATASLAAGTWVARGASRRVQLAPGWKRHLLAAVIVLAPVVIVEQAANAWTEALRPVGIDPFARLWHFTRISVGGSGVRALYGEDGSGEGFVGSPERRAFCRARLNPGWTGSDVPGASESNVWSCGSVATAA